MDKPLNQHEQIRRLCNDTLYALERGMFKGEDMQYVLTAKQFMASLRQDMADLIANEAKQAVEAANKPVAVAPVTVEAKVG